MSDLYAVIGNPVAHSKSPLIHAGFARQSGQDIQYEAIFAPLDGFVETVDAFRQRSGKGANVTVPFKLEAHALSSRLTERAKAAGAVNTFVFEANDILGDNTDGAGLVRDVAVNLGYRLNERRVLLLGAGGAARGVIRPLLEHEPAALVIANRTRQKADDLQQLFALVGNVVSAAYGDLRGQEFDLVINATSASLHGDLAPLPKGIFASASLAYDMMYGKGLTPFLQFAQQQGVARVADGIGMLVEQAAESFFLWRGIRPETKPVIEMLRSSLPTP